MDKMTAVDTDSPELATRSSVRRARQQIVEQHRNIELLFLALTRAVASGRKAETRAAFNDYRRVVSDHFAVEEQLLFPAIQREDVSRKPEIERLIRSHDRLLDELGQMETQLERLARGDFSRRLYGFVTMFEIHENKEMTLFSVGAAERVA